MKLNTAELKFLAWFLRLSPDNPIENPKQNTIFKNSIDYTDQNFIDIYKKIIRNI